MCKRLSLLNHKKTQYIEFFGTQVNSLAAHMDHSLLKIHAQFRSLDFGNRLFGSRTSQRCTNARQQFSDCERFYNVIVRPRIQSDDLVMFRVADRHHDNGPFKGRSNLAASLKPTHARHVHIQKNEIGTLPDDPFDGLLAVLCLYDVVAITGESCSQDAPDLRLALDHPNGLIIYWSAAFLSACLNEARAEQLALSGRKRKARAVRNA